MVFINPIEILELQEVDFVTIDNTLIKKAKRKLFADIDLSEDGHYTYKGIKVTKSDCERAIIELDDNEKKEFYIHLASNKLLNNYLASGNEQIFQSFKQESIYKLPEFVNFISLSFSVRFDKSLCAAFKEANLPLITAIIRTKALIEQTDINAAFKSLSNEIQNRIKEIDLITEEIKECESEYQGNTIYEIVEIVERNFPIEILNGLPPYFQSQINKIAASINYLALAIWNEFTTPEVPMILLRHLLSLNVEDVHKPTYENNYKIFKEKNEEAVEQEKNAPLLKTWANILIEIRKLIQLCDEKKMLSTESAEKIKSLFNISELNALPGFANEIRNQIGYSIRSLSISTWNVQNDIKSALSLINFALQINVSNEAKEKFTQDRIELTALETKYKGILICYFCETNPPDENAKIFKTIYKETYRSYFPRRVQYSYVQVEIPRCSKCMELHTKGNEKYLIILWVCIGLGAVIGALIEEHFIIGGIIGALVGWVAGKATEGNKITKEGIKDASNSSLAKHPLLTSRITDGWKFNKPSA